MNSNVKLVWITPDAEKQIAYITRVSNFKNQDNPNYKGLIKYCLKEKHWSPFEMSCMCLEIETTRAISAQILRHKSMKFQEFSQRYSVIPKVMSIEARRQDTKNRQNSISDLSPEDQDWFNKKSDELWEDTKDVYEEALKRGIAKECARFILPMRSYTKLYMQGTIRDWIHYIELRTANGTQLEHQKIALLAKEIFIKELPTVASALGWIN